MILNCMRAHLKDCPSSLPVCLSTCTVLFFLLINTLLASLLLSLWKFFSAKLNDQGLCSPTSGLVARSDAFTAVTGLISGWEAKPSSKPLQVEATGDHIYMKGKVLSDLHVLTHSISRMMHIRHHCFIIYR